MRANLMKQSEANVYEPTLRHYAVILPFFLLIRMLQATVRLRSSERGRAAMSAPERLVGVAWHSRIFFLSMCKYEYRPKFPMNGLVSASKDGAYLCALFRLMGIGSVRGSHKRRGIRAVMELVDSIKGGSDVFITPDGPRGPKNKIKDGFAVVAKESGARIVALKITPKSYWRISKTWDKFIIPKPFSSAFVEPLEFKSYADLEAAAAERGTTPSRLIEDYLNSDGID